MSIHDSIATAMPPLSHLQCTICGQRQEVGDVAASLRGGWPTCCKGYAMQLFTVRQVEEMTR